ncbi:unnamed protein product (macronuclear) [Paramecium tetraurelia]|uniref:DNA mismatch repair protein n=1 Tax=Paramecium tetraurelia TaxID=5888 RepID=A0BIQ0_PARTE|nr:uncharacterized protein GSPATT00004789001 [Paramecium tetraurelia]CAK58417.1 unnamed protein product [Paramecium tetraurelia]|eukprot:XP_001425815.1 hypothetical protein (macronuclear) [Paramecium tetraurelia strain d4-2]
MKQTTLQRFLTSSQKKNDTSSLNVNKTSNSNTVFEEKKVDIQYIKPSTSITKEEVQAIKDKLLEKAQERPQQFSRLKRNNVVESDEEQEKKNEFLDEFKIEKFSFVCSQEKNKERKSLAVFVKQDIPKNNIKSQQKQKKSEYDKSGKMKKQSVKLEEEEPDDFQENKQGNLDFKLPTDKINVHEEFDDVTPQWATIGSSRDKSGKLHGTSDADPTTLFIPQNEFNKLTKCMQQFWKYKSENFDKIIFFKLGKFYELFYEDAYIGNKYLDLNWMGRKMHTGFPEKAVHKYKALLLEYGYKVVIVDQTETPEQMNQRVAQNKKAGVGNTDKIVQRSVSEILTKGTYLYEEGESQMNLDEKVLLVIRKKILSNTIEEYGMAILERQTNTISLAFIENRDKNYESLKTLLLHMRPVETVIDSNNLPSFDPITKMISGSVIKSVISHITASKDNWDEKKALFRLEQYYQNGLPAAIKFYKNNQVVLQALNGLFTYLNQILILDRVLGCAQFKLYDEEFSLQQCMILDSQAIYHLEILQTTNQVDKKDFSLFGVLNKTVTPGGHRLLRRWVCAPLYQIDQIRERQTMVCDISNFRKERDLFRQSIKQFPDFERRCSRIYEYSIKTESKAVFYENLSEQRLKEFKNLTKSLRLAQQEIALFGQYKINFRSERLRNMMTYEADGGLLPNVKEQLDEFEQYIIWEKEKDKEVPKPVTGVLESYDQSVAEVELVEQKLDSYLQQIKRKLFKNNSNIQYAHAKFRYEIEIPDELVQKSKPEDFEFTSSRQGYKRYLTQEIKDLVTELEQAEETKKQQLTAFGNFIFKHFHSNQHVWDSLIKILNELDALCSLSVYGDTSEGKMTVPKFTTDKIKLVIKEGKHPCLTNINFVSNSIDMGEKLTKFQLLTGPNMGGKSTTLRMVCILAVLAQIGCSVPCEEMELSPIDRIFTRIGAKDYLMEGKSTFYVELEETLIPLKYGTKNSLFITDELGRGTSTYDGVAIASAVMHYLIKTIQCRVLFATHFRILIEEAKLISEVTNVHMACYISNGKVIFLYRLKEGACEASFGINVAKVVGIEDSIIMKAEEMANFFENKVQKNTEQTLQKFNQIINEYGIIQGY